MSSRTQILALGVAALLTVSACGTGNTPSAAEPDTANLRVWVMGDSVPAAAATWLETTFAQEHEGSTLKVERQPWTGIVAKLQTSLPSKTETPDIVEVGNTGASTFTSVGAFSALDGIYEDLGGKNLVQGGVAAGSWDGKFYATPFYQGSRVIYYRKDLLKKANIAVPTTMAELNLAAVALNKANPEKTPNFTGIYLPAVDYHTQEGWLFTNGGNYASQDAGGKWVGQLSTQESLEGLKQVQDLSLNATTYASDSIEGVNGAPDLFNAGKIGFLSALNSTEQLISPAMWKNDQVGVMSLPGKTPGTAGMTFAGGSNIGISAMSPNQKLSQEAMKLIFSETFQSYLASDGSWIPGNLSYAAALTGLSSAASTEAAAASRLTPATPAWGVADSAGFSTDFWTRIAKGEDVTAVAKETDAKLNDILNK
ncbi:extracellular solute-binding protein [Arthrobacter alpinus]|nr:extracellular solute-binding protein [Arthrobacter alpinus]